MTSTGAKHSTKKHNGQKNLNTGRTDMMTWKDRMNGDKMTKMQIQRKKKPEWRIFFFKGWIQFIKFWGEIVCVSIHLVILAEWLAHNSPFHRTSFTATSHQQPFFHVKAALTAAFLTIAALYSLSQQKTPRHCNCIAKSSRCIKRFQQQSLKLLQLLSLQFICPQTFAFHVLAYNP